MEKLVLPPVALPADHVPVKAGRVGVLLVNLGSPDAPDVPAVKAFLGEFLSDPRVIEIPQIIWRPIPKRRMYAATFSASLPSTS